MNAYSSLEAKETSFWPLSMQRCSAFEADSARSSEEKKYVYSADCTVYGCLVSIFMSCNVSMICAL